MLLHHLPLTSESRKGVGAKRVQAPRNGLQLCVSNRSSSTCEVGNGEASGMAACRFTEIEVGNAGGSQLRQPALHIHHNVSMGRCVMYGPGCLFLVGGLLALCYSSYDELLARAAGHNSSVVHPHMYCWQVAVQIPWCVAYFYDHWKECM